jgi:hypothetical protein
MLELAARVGWEVLRGVAVQADPFVKANFETSRAFPHRLNEQGLKPGAFKLRVGRFTARAFLSLGSAQ